MIFRRSWIPLASACAIAMIGLAHGQEYEVRKEFNVRVPMRDGVEMSLDIYRPQADGRFPTILNRTPYDNNRHFASGMKYARQGYVYITSDARGRHDSDGEWVPVMNEADDGFDTQEWIGAQPWSDRNICTTGGSYEGWTQWMPAPQDSKYLTCMLPEVAPPHLFRNLPYENGVPFMFIANWMLIMDGRTMQIRGRSLREIFLEAFFEDLYDWDEIQWTLPLKDLDNAAGYDIPWWDDWMEHDSYDAFWDRADYQARIARIDVPVYQISSWYDHDFPGTFLNFPLIESHGHPDARKHQKMLITPFGHWYYLQTDGRFGSMDFGPGSVVDADRERQRWFDHWLKGIDNGIMDEPRVKVFVMGANQWRTADTWPLPETEYREWYLSSGGHANTLHGDGRLTTEPPRNEERQDRYRYDPADPAPSAPPLDPPVSIMGPEDLRPIHSRNDVLVYQTDPLDEPIEVVGPVTLKLHAASSALDTDWFVRLSDVHPDGYAMRLGHGVLRARFRNSISAPEPLEPGKAYEYTIDVWPTGNRFRKGHRIRLDVTSSAFPLFARNLNTGRNNQTTTEMVVAEQTVFHGPSHPSRLILPVVPIRDQ